MTGQDAPPATPLFEKLSLVTHHHLLTRVPVKLDLENWNYRSLEFFVDQIYGSYDVESIFMVFPMQPGRVLPPLSYPKNSKWTRSCFHGSLPLYPTRFKLVVTILTSLDAHVNNEDVIHYALEGLPATYDQVCCYMHYKDTFLDLKTAHVNYRRDAVEVQVSISTCGFIVRFSYGAYGRFR
ncbi:hypothetical protein Tco_0867502 [Tanacetum coccineum]